MKHNLIQLTLARVLATTLFVPVISLFQLGNNGTSIAENKNDSSDENPFTYTRRDLIGNAFVK